MFKSLIKRLNWAIGNKKNDIVSTCSWDQFAHSFRIPERVAMCPYCGSKLICEIGERKKGVVGRTIRIACTTKCKSWADQTPSNELFHKVLKSVLGYVSNCY